MKRLANFLVTLAGVAVLSYPAYAGNPMPPMHAGPAGGMDFMTLPSMHGSCPTPEFFMENSEFLGLSPLQVAELKKLDFALKKQQLVKGAGVRVLELELTEIVTRPGFETDDALNKLKDIEKARTELRAEVIKASAKARDMLDAGQAERLAELLLTMPTAGMRMPGGAPQSPKAVERDSVKEQMMREMMQRNMP